ncbi:sensory transduction protein kinase [Thioploca ingrica]|uniref:histidine kinase n=1 Tax=Thioploca ingrica TaxID=40754 RepID=A0A090ACG7_9GAMM|nr:sensory transduction protein kinase [Thioploca ingrica]
MQLLSSLRHKITFGYYIVVTLFIALVLLILLELRLIEPKILAEEWITAFFDTVLEIRRFEKNCFLYRQAEDCKINSEYIHQAQELLASHRIDFEQLISPQTLKTLQEELCHYAQFMNAYEKAPQEIQEQKIRQMGKKLVEYAEKLTNTERFLLQNLLAKYRSNFRKFVILVIILILLVLGWGQLLSHQVARPLQQMEAGMQAIAGGKRDKLDLSSPDREIVLLTETFNRLLAELEVRQHHLVRSEKLASLGTLLSGVAHELNNPLSNISTSCQILQEELGHTDVEFQRELLAQIDEQTGRARNIVRSLLDFTHNRQFQCEPLYLHALLTETIRFIKGQLPSQVNLSLEIPTDLIVLGDKQRLQQVFLNLLKNAIAAVAERGEIQVKAIHWSGKTSPLHLSHFSPSGSPLTITGADKEMVYLEIRDNGCGIAPAVLQRIFDPFFTTKEVGHGSGLGLFIVYEIIKEQGGYIAVDSQLGKGTTFAIWLPTGIPNA